MPRKKTTSFSVGTLIFLVVVALVVFWIQNWLGNESTPVDPLDPGNYLLCVWNVENYFDNVDHNRGVADETYDDWFAQNPKDFQLKLDRITDVLISFKQGQGPDIIALAEVENQHAGELLLQALNKKISDPALHYKYVLMKEVAVGRHIAPVIVTRLPVTKKPKQLGRSKQRTVEGRIQPKNGPELIVVASHWTSRRNGGEDGRKEYAQDIYGRFRAIWTQNPNVDFLACGDFNDTPDDLSLVRHLQATGDAVAVRAPNPPQPVLLNLMAGKSPSEFGTHYYSGWIIFDQIVVSPGMLDHTGWSVQPDSIRTVKYFTTADGAKKSLEYPNSRNRRPWRFGSRTDDPKRRGYSDHFPVTAVLTLHTNQQTALAR